MMPSRALLLVLGCLAACVLAACASVPSVPVPAGSRVVVRLYDPEDGVELALANETYPELADIYSKARPDPNLKLAPDQLVGELLASLDNAGLAAFGRSGGPDDPHGAQGYLLVDQDGRQRVFPEPAPEAGVEERRAFIRIKLVMGEYYQHVGGLQFVDNPRGRALFEDAR